MFLETHQRTSDSPYIERVWHSQSNHGGQMTSIASTTWDLVFWDLAGRTHVTVHGPETHATHIPVPAGAATGLTPGAVRRIERARRAAVLLRDGWDVADVVHMLGYYDGPHLRHALTRFIGRTPARLRNPLPTEQMSLLYTTRDSDAA